MKKLFVIFATIAGAMLASGCTRITTGEVGLRVDMSRQVQGAELVPGSWNQTVVGDVITFPVRDININLDNKTPMTADNSALADFDVSVIYSITPTAVSELYSTKSKSFHQYDEREKDTLLMFNYMTTLLNNASYKAVRQFKALEVADNRAKIEADIRDTVMATLKDEKLDTSLNITLVQIRNIAPNAQIMESATAFVKSQNELKIKENEVEIAKKEAERMAALSANATQSIAMMNAQANMKIAQGIAEGKVQTIVVPYDFKGIVNVGKQ